MSERVPSSREMMLPVLRAVGSSGSASQRQIRDDVEAAVDPEGRWEGLVYRSGDSHLAVRIAWATNYLWRGGLLDRPHRNLYLLSDKGAPVAAMPDDEAASALEDAYKAASEHYAAPSPSQRRPADPRRKMP